MVRAERGAVAFGVNTPVRGLPEIVRATRISSGDLESSRRADGVVVFTGRGFGHGVGMCQYCSKGFADQGWTYRKMLEMYYPGARLVVAYRFGGAGLRVAGEGGR